MTHAPLRLLAAAALLAMGSCSTTPDTTPSTLLEDGAANHPIMVEPSYRALKLDWAPEVGGLPPAGQAELGAFVSDYSAHGNGAIAISAPNTMGGQNAAQWFAARINAMGVSRDRILISTHDAANGDLRVEVNYVTYQARTGRCGDWSDDLSLTLMNNTPKNFGCAVQQNIAAMVSDPRDLVSPRGLDASDAGRRVTVINNYEQGKVTQAEKHTADATVEQSSGASKVGSQ